MGLSTQIARFIAHKKWAQRESCCLRRAHLRFNSHLHHEQHSQACVGCFSFFSNSKKKIQESRSLITCMNANHCQMASSHQSKHLIVIYLQEKAFFHLSRFNLNNLPKRLSPNGARSRRCNLSRVVDSTTLNSHILCVSVESVHKYHLYI